MPPISPPADHVMSTTYNTLFILKHRQLYGSYSVNLSSGLTNSARFVVDMLNTNNRNAGIVQVVDGNGIDKEVHKYKPHTVILEAIWCPPYKLIELQKLYPNIKWIVRIHSEIPFLSNEGIALTWLNEYSKIPNVIIAANSERIIEYLKKSYPNVIWLPNYYFYENIEFKKSSEESDLINIGCFGAIRPMKNQLIQAYSAIEYARRKNKILWFHVNGGRVEQGGQQVLKNLQSLFKNTDRACLVEHTWYDHVDFLHTIHEMDLSMSVSFTETFNIITGDAVFAGVPIVTSKEVTWVNPSLMANPTDINDIVAKMESALGWWKNSYIKSNRKRLNKFNAASQTQWLKEIR